MGKRIIFYGDIHGCLEELELLRKQISPQKGDIEVSVGDFINKGPYSLNTLRYLRYHDIKSVMGNNEAQIIKCYKKYQKEGKSYLKTIRKTTKKTVLELEDQDISYLETLPYFLKFNNLTVVHGGIVNGMRLHDKMHEKEKKLLTQLRYFNTKHEPIPYDDFEGRDLFWSEDYDGKEGFVIFGHHPFPEPKIDKYAIGIDTGCVYDGTLTAVVFDYDTQIDTSKYTFYQQKALKAYFS